LLAGDDDGVGGVRERDAVLLAELRGVGEIRVDLHHLVGNAEGLEGGADARVDVGVGHGASAKTAPSPGAGSPNPVTAREGGASSGDSTICTTMPSASLGCRNASFQRGTVAL